MDHRTHRAAQRIEGRPAAPGIALGPLVRLAPVKHDARQYRSAAEEHQALVDALAASQEDLSLLAREAGDAEAEAILAFQIALLEDDSLAAPAFAQIAMARPPTGRGAPRSTRKSLPTKRPKMPISAAAPPICAICAIACCDISRARPIRSCRPA
jgi:hypothetical protein